MDNQLVGTKTVGIAFDREARDIQWSFESENAKTRIGLGHGGLLATREAVGGRLSVG